MEKAVKSDPQLIQFKFIAPVKLMWQEFSVLSWLALLLVTNGLFVYQIFKLVQLDDSICGMKHPKFWDFLKLTDKGEKAWISISWNEIRPFFPWQLKRKKNWKPEKNACSIYWGWTQSLQFMSLSGFKGNFIDIGK